MPRNLKIAVGILVAAVLIGLISLRGLQRRMTGIAESQSADEQARREVLAPEMSTSSDAKVETKIYWAAGEDRVAPTTIALALSYLPAVLGKQLLQALIANPTTA
jgi:hypothetical protein